MPLLLLAPSLSPSSQGGVRVSREVLCLFRCLPEPVPWLYCTLSPHVGTRSVPVCRLPYQQAHEGLKDITPLLLETEAQGKSPGFDPGFRQRNLGQCWHTKEVSHIFPIFLGALAADTLLTFIFLNSVYTISLQRALPYGNPCCSSLRCYCLQLPALSLCPNL